LSKELNDMHGLASTLYHTAIIAYFERNCAEVERFASEVIELATRQHFAHWLALGSTLRGWAHSASGGTDEGLSWIESGIRDYRATGAMVGLTAHLARKAEALYLADRTSEALEAINEAEALAERFELGFFSAELHRLRGVFLAAIGGEESQIEVSFCEAIRIAKEQKSVSLATRAEATYAEYHRQKASRSGGRGFRLPLC
jgi:adenylate cyclase